LVSERVDGGFERHRATCLECEQCQQRALAHRAASTSVPSRSTLIGPSNPMLTGMSSWYRTGFGAC
jgi:hypothetical protein